MDSLRLPSGLKRKTAPILVNIALCMASVIVTTLLAEGTLRLIGYGEESRKMLGHAQFPRFYHQADPVNGYDITPDFPASEFKVFDYVQTFGTGFAVASNDLGCRDKAIERGDRYVLLLGDSFVWANVPFEHAFGTLIEHLIGVRVLKCGVSGYGTRHELRKLEQITKHVGRPNVIVVGYFVGNDLVDDYLYPEYTVLDGYLMQKVDLHKTSNAPGERHIYSDEELMKQISERLFKQPTTFVLDVKDFMTTHIRVYNLLKNARGLRQLASSLGLADPPPPPSVVRRTAAVFHSLDEYAWLRDAWMFHLDNLRQLKQSADEQNAKVLIVIIPTADQVYEYLRPSGEALHWEYPNRRLTQFFEKEGISFLDLLGEFKKHADPKHKPALNPRTDLYWHTDRHLNMQGNRLAGLVITRFLLEHQFLELQDSTERLAATLQQLAKFN